MALLREMTCNLRHPIGLWHPVGLLLANVYAHTDNTWRRVDGVKKQKAISLKYLLIKFNFYIATGIMHFFFHPILPSGSERRARAREGKGLQPRSCRTPLEVLEKNGPQGCFLRWLAGQSAAMFRSRYYRSRHCRRHARAAGRMFAASKSRLYYYRRIVLFLQRQIRWNAL